MTRKELSDKHFDIWVDNNEESREDEHADLSIQYAINVMEDVKQKCANSFFHKSAKIFEDKIDELKKLLK